MIQTSHFHVQPHIFIIANDLTHYDQSTNRRPSIHYHQSAIRHRFEHRLIDGGSATVETT